MDMVIVILLLNFGDEMKYLLLGLLTLLSVLPKEQLLGSAVGCPKRYLRRINGKCYYFSVKKLNWFGALNNCLRKGLTLADLSNPGDFYGAIDFLRSKGNTEDFWFGGNDLEYEGRFQYISNGRLVKFFSNYSIVEPTDRSECDDCLEARIRSNLTMVADDNCLERQYFICSERYCNDYYSDTGKPRHHSHEHLHHFHHDIGDEDEGESNEENPSRSGSGSDENDGNNNSEADVAGENLPDHTPETNPDTDITETVDEEENDAETNNDTTAPNGYGEPKEPTTENDVKQSSSSAAPGEAETETSPPKEAIPPPEDEKPAAPEGNPPAA